MKASVYEKIDDTFVWTRTIEDVRFVKNLGTQLKISTATTIYLLDLAQCRVEIEVA